MKKDCTPTALTAVLNLPVGCVVVALIGDVMLGVFTANNMQSETITKAFELAQENGYELHSKWRSLEYYEFKVLLDPQFFQALGKAMGWKGTTYFQMGSKCRNEMPDWIAYWHRFIDKIADGGTPDDFFEDLLK